MVLLFIGGSVRICIVMALVFIALLQLRSVAQQIEGQQSWSNIGSLMLRISTESKNDFLESTNDGYELASSAVNLEWKQYALGTLALTLAALSFSADNSFYDLAYEHQSASNDRVITRFEQYGSGITGLAVGGSLYLVGHLGDQPSFRETGRQVISALTLTAITTTTLKIIFGRKRPYTHSGTYTFETFRLNAEAWSFPSGHAATAFALSSVLSSRISHPLATLMLYSCATLTASQRVYDQKHWFSDVVAGAMIGTTVGLFVSRPGDQVQEQILGGWEIAPVVSAPSVGLVFRKAI